MSIWSELADLATDITNKFYNSEVDEVRLLYTQICFDDKLSHYS